MYLTQRIMFVIEKIVTRDKTRKIKYIRVYLDIDAILFQSTGRNSLLRSAALKHSVPILIKIQWHLCSNVLPGNSAAVASFL